VWIGGFLFLGLFKIFIRSPLLSWEIRCVKSNIKKTQGIPHNPQSEKADVAFFFKQWGGTSKKKTGRVLEGRTWDEMPEFPELYSRRN
jgi:hypothetical protein